MLKPVITALLLGASIIALSACVVEGPGHPRCPGAWIPAHTGPEGGFHPGHCA